MRAEKVDSQCNAIISWIVDLNIEPSVSLMDQQVIIRHWIAGAVLYSRTFAMPVRTA